MDKWPEVFSDIIGSIRNTMTNNLEDMVGNVDIKVETPQPYIDDQIKIPEPEVKS